MRRWLRCRRRCSGLALLVLLTAITVIGYAVLLSLHHPLSHLELVPRPATVQTADAGLSTPSTSRHLPAADLAMDARTFCGGIYTVNQRKIPQHENCDMSEMC